MENHTLFKLIDRIARHDYGLNTFSPVVTNCTNGISVSEFQVPRLYCVQAVSITPNPTGVPSPVPSPVRSSVCANAWVAHPI